jgi:hypothetical protein
LYRISLIVSFQHSLGPVEEVLPTTSGTMGGLAQVHGGSLFEAAQATTTIITDDEAAQIRIQELELKVAFLTERAQRQWTLSAEHRVPQDPPSRSFQTALRL